MESRGCSECISDYGFGFNDPRFSDRTIQLDIITPYLADSQPDSVHDTVLSRKRNRLNAPDNDGSLEKDSGDGHKTDKSDGNPCSPNNCSTETKTIHVSTLILAGKSSFFYKLFSNGMAESNQQHVTLQIQKSEEAAFMDMLKFMYTNTLSETTPSVLLDLLVAADKYEVPSCTKYCFHSMQNSPMTCESALLYLDLQSTILLGDDTVQSLKDSAKQFLVARFKDINKFENEMLGLPLFGIEAVLSSDNLQVSSEDEIFDFVMIWARRHYTRPCERQEILNTRLLCLIRFSFMSKSKLMEVLTCTDINLEQRSKLVFDAISLETPHPWLPPTKEHQRAYKLLPLKVVRVDSPWEEVVVYLDLKREVCASFLPDVEICSRPFVLGGQAFHLMLKKTEDMELNLCKQENGPLGVELSYSLRRDDPNLFFYASSYEKLDYESAGHKKFGILNNYYGPWHDFIEEGSPYFINGVVHARLELRIRK